MPTNPINKKGACQEKMLARYNENGTPKVEAMEKDDITAPIAVPLRSYMEVSATIDKTWAAISPPNSPARILANSRRW